MKDSLLQFKAQKDTKLNIDQLDISKSTLFLQDLLELQGPQTKHL